MFADNLPVPRGDPRNHHSRVAALSHIHLSFSVVRGAPTALLFRTPRGPGTPLLTPACPSLPQKPQPPKSQLPPGTGHGVLSTGLFSSPLSSCRAAANGCILAFLAGDVPDTTLLWSPPRSSSMGTPRWQLCLALSRGLPWWGQCWPRDQPMSSAWGSPCLLILPAGPSGSPGLARF